MTPNQGFKATVLCKGEHFKRCICPTTDHLLNLQCNVPLTRSHSAKVELLVFHNRDLAVI